MMAPLKLIAAILVMLFSGPSSSFAISSAFNPLSLEKIAQLTWQHMAKYMPKEGLTNPDVAYGFAHNYINRFSMDNAETGRELLRAMHVITPWRVHCNESSLGYIATMSRCIPTKSAVPSSLIDATEKYARECLTSDIIAQNVRQQSSGSLLTGWFTTKTDDVELIDDQFITDYWSEHPGDKKFSSIEGLESDSEAVAKAIIRDSKNKIKDLKDIKKVHSYLKKRLYTPCSMYSKALSKVVRQVTLASAFWDGGYDNLISSLNNETQRMFFRYHLCKNSKVLEYESESLKMSGQVMSALEKL